MNNGRNDGPERHGTGADDWLRAAQLEGGTGTFRLDLQTYLWDTTPQLAVLFGFDKDVRMPRLADWEGAIFIDDVPKVRAAIEAAKTGGSYYVELRVHHPDGGVHWLAGKGHVRRDEPGAPQWLFGSYFDITDRKVLEARLLAVNEMLEARVNEVREEARMLEILNRTGVAVAAELDLARLVQIVTDAGTELTGAQFGAFFYNTVDAEGEAYTLYTLSGVPREAFSKFPMPRNTAIFERTFRGLGTLRSDDILTDPRYGQNSPYHGMPKGHLPVRSYLAVPVISRSGEVLGGLFFGHANLGVFTERSERILTVIAAQASVAIDNARLHHARADAEQALQRLNETLEQRVEERTQQLRARSDQLRESEDRFRLVIEAATDYAIFMLDERGTIATWNAGAKRIKGYDAEEIIGQHFSRFYTEEDRRAGLPEKILANAARSGKLETEGWRVRKDCTLFWASVTIATIRDPAGELLGFAKITRDLTEQRNTEDNCAKRTRWKRSVN